MEEKVMHEYNCFFCGEQLYELRLGFLECRCGKQFLPYFNKQNHPCLICVYIPEGEKNENKLEGIPT